jgi:hypothetical protein
VKGKTRLGLGIAMLGVAAAMLGGACGTFSSETTQVPPDAAADAKEAPSAECTEPDLVNDPNAAPDTSCGADLATAPEHCGACGRSCGGDACEGGVCRRRRFPSDDYLVSAAWAHGDRVFAFRPTGELEAIGSDGSRTRIGQSLFVNVERVTGDETHLYATIAGAEGRQYVRITIADGFHEDLVALGNEPGVLAVGEESIYLATASSVLRIPKQGSSVTSQPATGARSIAIRGDDAFWVARDHAKPTEFAVYGPMSREPVRLASSRDIVGVATDAEYAYFADLGRGIVRVPLSGGRAQDVAKETGEIRTVAMSGEHVYWAVKTTTSFAIKRVSRCGGLPLLVAEGIVPVDAMSFGGGKLYVTSGPQLYAVAQ